MGSEALISQSTTKSRYDLQDLLVSLSSQHEGYTMTQLAWLAVGGTVDASGYCQPADAFAMTLAFFNAKRRGCEIARNQEEPTGRRPNAKLVYGKAVRNPYEFGGAGVYPINPAKVRVKAAKPVGEAEPKPSPASLPKSFSALLD